MLFKLDPNPLHSDKINSRVNGFYRLSYTVDRDVKVDSIWITKYYLGNWNNFPNINIYFDKADYSYALTYELYEINSSDSIEMIELYTMKNQIIKASVEELDRYLQSYLFLKKENQPKPFGGLKHVK